MRDLLWLRQDLDILYGIFAQNDEISVISCSKLAAFRCLWAQSIWSVCCACFDGLQRCHPSLHCEWKLLAVHAVLKIGVAVRYAQIGTECAADACFDLLRIS